MNRKEIFDDNFDKIPREEPELLPSAFELLENEAPELILELLDRMCIRQELLEEIVGRKIVLNKSLLLAPEDKKVVRLSAFRKRYSH